MRSVNIPLLVVSCACFVLTVQCVEAGRSSDDYRTSMETMDIQGGTVSNGTSLVIDVSMGGLLSVSSNGAGIMLKSGFGGQIYNLVEMQVGASPSNVDETTTFQLTGIGTFDDGTTGGLEGNPIWSIVSGPIASVDTSGVALAGNVYQDTAAQARGEYDSKTGTVQVLVVNVGTDDYLSYAGDGLPDDWQVDHFGEENLLAAPDKDPDEDGPDNLDEWTADTHPSNAFSVLMITGITHDVADVNVSWKGGVLARQVLERNTTLISTAGQWTAIFTNDPPTATTTNFTDTTATNRVLLYRIKASRP